MKDGSYWVAALQAGRISYGELYQEIANRVAKHNPQLNALVTWDLAGSLAQQEATPDLLQRPFAGLPIPLKMLGQNKKGWLNTNGSRLMAEERARKTDHFVSRMEAIGLIPLGQTNSPEFGFKNITDPELYGPTKNAWDHSRTPGGSSGGAASAVASGMFPMAAASDGGGSIRIPASYSGLIGLKPSRGQMPVGPSNWRGWQGAAVNFFLTVSIRDTQKLFRLMKGTERAAPYQVPAVKPVEKKRLRIAVITESPVGTPVSEEARAAVVEAGTFLTSMGHDVTEVAWPIDGAALIRSYYLMNGAETAGMFADLAQELGNVDESLLETSTRALWRFGELVSAADYVRSLHLWDQASAQMEAFHEKYDLLLTPTTAQVAPKLTRPWAPEATLERLTHISELSLEEAQEAIWAMFADSLAMTPFTPLANLTGQPAISLPTHLTKDGLPLGVQLIAARGQEELLLQVGALFEAAGLFHLPEAYR